MLTSPRLPRHAYLATSSLGRGCRRIQKEAPRSFCEQARSETSCFFSCVARSFAQRKAIDGTRTRDLRLGKAAYYQLYHYRVLFAIPDEQSILYHPYPDLSSLEKDSYRQNPARPKIRRQRTVPCLLIKPKNPTAYPYR